MERYKYDHEANKELKQGKLPEILEVSHHSSSCSDSGWWYRRLSPISVCVPTGQDYIYTLVGSTKGTINLNDNTYEALKGVSNGTITCT